MKNPLPGMNPWLEEFWRDVHASLLVYARDVINGELPPGLRARVDERLAIDWGHDDGPRTFLPDVAITEPWDQPAREVLMSQSSDVALADPEIVDLGDELVRHLEIVDSREHVITAIEVLSPTNKDRADSYNAWFAKRVNYLKAGINLVEIDLLRGGIWVLPPRGDLRPVPPGRVCHHVCVTRPPRLQVHEFYVMPLRQRLPAIRVPLRRTDPDVALDLQALIDASYERGRYGEVIDYSKPPDPPLPEEEAAWAREIVGEPHG